MKDWIKQSITLVNYKMIKKLNEKKLKVLVLVCDLNKGGVQRTAQNFADGFKEIGHESRLMAVNEGGSREKDLKKIDVKYWIRLNKKNLKELKEWMPDILILQDCGIKHNQIKLLKELLSKTIFIEQNTFSIPSKWQNLLDYSFQMTNWCAWKYKRSLKSNHKIVQVLPYPIKISNFYPENKSIVKDLKKELNIPINNLVIGRIGQSNEGKWSKLLIKTFNSISLIFKDLNLVLVNPPNKIITQVNQSRFRKNIILIDKVIGDENLRKIYSMFDVFALVADQGESFGHVLAESMLCEVPSVVLSTPWFDNSQVEVVGHMKGGLVALSSRGFQSALIEILRNKKLRLNLGKNARGKIINEYSHDKICTELINKITNNNYHKNSGSSKKIINIYSNAFEKPNILTVALLLSIFNLSFTRVTSGYQTIIDYLKRLLKILIYKLKKFK